MNLTDLRDVLDERSSTDRIEAHSHLTLSGVRHRLVIRRRRRQIAAAAAFVLVLALGAGSLVIGRTPATKPVETKPGPATINGFPEYANGARVIASASLVPPAKDLQLTFTPDSTVLSFFIRCAPGADAAYDVRLNGHRVTEGSGCGTTLTADTASLDSDYGVRVGRSSTLIATFAAGPPAGFAMAVGEPVPNDQYVFPSRPAALNPIDLSEMVIGGEGQTKYRTATTIRPDPTNPNRPVSRTFTFGEGVNLLMRSQTPGALTISIDGVKVASGQWWDYEQILTGGGSDQGWPVAAKRKKGETFTLTITPRRMTGDWAVAFQVPDKP